MSIVLQLCQNTGYHGVCCMPGKMARSMYRLVLGYEACWESMHLEGVTSYPQCQEGVSLAPQNCSWVSAWKELISSLQKGGCKHGQSGVQTLCMNERAKLPDTVCVPVTGLVFHPLASLGLWTPICNEHITLQFLFCDCDGRVQHL